MKTASEKYNLAASHLVHYGGHNGNTSEGRKLVADALTALRQIDRKMAANRRQGLLFISGQFPVKEVA